MAALKAPKINFTRSKGRRTLDAVEGFVTSVGFGTDLKGDLGGNGHTIVMGSVEGDCDIEGTVVIGETGKWTGNITATNVVIAGEVEGEVHALEKLEILSTARVKGLISSHSLAIAEGAIHEGEVQMSSPNGVKRFTDMRNNSDPDHS